MARMKLRPFFLNIVLPSILAIVFFILAIFAFILPSFEKNILEKKKEMIRELTITAWSLIDEYHHEYLSGNLTLEEAKSMASRRIREIRYGDQHKDYFWIISQEPVMIMHPYREELEGKKLDDYTDPDGKKLFVEASRVVADNGEGFINYRWQWKDDSTTIVPKLSYVRGFEPWNWIIGTGIYLDDVNREIKAMKKNILQVSFFIIMVVAIILMFVIRQSSRIEDRRKEAEKKLRLSRQKYKSLVEASTEGTLMVVNQSIIFSNQTFNRLTGYEAPEVIHLSFEDVFKTRWQDVISSFDDPKKSVSLETKLICNDNSEKEVVINISKIKHAGEDGYIVVTREILPRDNLERDTFQLAEDLQTSLILMNQPVNHIVKDIITCSSNITIREAIDLMARKRTDVLFIRQNAKIIGVLNHKDIINRVLVKNKNMDIPVIEVMSSPVRAIPENSLLYEAILVFNEQNISHLGITDGEDTIKGMIILKDIFALQQFTPGYVLKEIESASDLTILRNIYERIPVLVRALVDSSDKTNVITRLISSVSDAITRRIILLSIEEIGSPPSRFAFMVMGSEGRMEQTLATDQDNAIIFEEVRGEKLDDAYSYFQKLGKRVNQSLNFIGYKLCKGEIMAMNPKWNQPIEIWKEYFNTWINSSDPQSVLDASIYFDFRHVYGDSALVDDLREHVNKTITNKSVFFYHLAQSVLRFKPPVSFFGNIIGNEPSEEEVILDIKKILMPVTGSLRLYALHNGLSETNSLQRCKKLYQKQILPGSLHDELVLSYNYLMNLRFRFQVSNIMQKLPPDNKIPVNKLTQIENATLKKIFGEIVNLQTKINFDFKGQMS